jgi:hypothetical protein
VFVGRPKAPTRLVLTEPMLGYLERCCTDHGMGRTRTDQFGQPRVDLRIDIVLELIRMARFGRGLARLNVRSFAARSVSAKTSAAKRWADPTARARQSAATREHWQRRRARMRDRAPAPPDPATKS